MFRDGKSLKKFIKKSMIIIDETDSERSDSLEEEDSIK